MVEKTILVIGTYDTKSDELIYLSECICKQGGQVLTMDVSVLGDTKEATDISKHQVAEAAESSIQNAIELDDENSAMQIMAMGASKLTFEHYASGKIDGIIVLGGTMGTDLALDCARALPIGVPKYIVSTIAFSPLIPVARLAPDIQMILWAGGLYGLNSVCKSSLSQAAGAVLGAARAVEPPVQDRPLIGMTSLGSSCLKYMKYLKPALEERGFEVAVFHSTGVGGMAFESLAREGKFACVMDFCMQEFVNGLFGSVVNSGCDRLTNAGHSGIPQIIAPGASDIVDFPSWQDLPENLCGRPCHVHNRLISSATLTPDERKQSAMEMLNYLSGSNGPVHIILPNQGIEEWDREGGPAYDPEGLNAYLEAMRKGVCDPLIMTEINAHINDELFVDEVLKIFDAWVDDGTVAS